MATVEECRAAIGKVSERIMEVDPADRRKHIVERTVSLAVTDLDTVFDMRLTEDGLQDVVERDAGGSARRAQVGITVSSDDLVALSEDRLDFAKAMLGGRVKLDASFGDLMRLRKLL
ncbi:SCP2 sterol-binding domain-containing protein [Streptomonospora sp. PA3]|uniref:SCP2 sterol-binding domain-containing protein n=1 Tax=Streptomonospora sp. PA3 TaxID=2607326 RepID=UPI0012DDF0BF|nr:SCP2 sterol-binding domain-containing protein [Streptomonospora sp. PA3]MUL43871.1 SCP2 sterol-binding domain-containing protein [Streptomonospora sp. PA3]